MQANQIAQINDMEASLTERGALKWVHLMTSSSTVLCGALMRDAQHPHGWDLGNVISELAWGRLTCPGCLAAIRKRQA